MATAMVMGDEYIKLMYAEKSMKRCASTAIKFTTSPTVVSLRAEFDIRKD